MSRSCRRVPAQNHLCPVLVNILGSGHSYFLECRFCAHRIKLIYLFHIDAVERVRQWLFSEEEKEILSELVPNGFQKLPMIYLSQTHQYLLDLR